MPAGQTSVCQMKAGAHVHTWLCANLHCMHCRLSRCIRSVAVHVEYPSFPATLEGGAVAQTQQVTLWPLRIWCFTCCRYRTAALCQALALLCLLVHHVLGSSCRLCRHMLMQEVRAAALDVL